MDSPVEYTDSISPVCLVPDCLNDENEQEVTAMGWGTTQSEGGTADYLRFAELSTVPRAKCEKVHGEKFMADQMICAYKEGENTCQVYT
jgi:hypothetical protein